MVLDLYQSEEINLMAHSDVLPDDVIDNLAAQIGSEAGRTLGAAILQRKTIEMTESFSIWALGADLVTKVDVDLSQLARQTGRWHHQIKVDGKAESFARSMPLGPSATDWSVRELFESEISQKIDDAIDWIDQNVQGDPLVRLLIIPAYHLHAFWLLDGTLSQVLVVDMPPSFTKLQYGRLYSSREFLETLSQEQHIIGLQ
jgi:hypothetical protein